jgi:hypothetical protein
MDAYFLGVNLPEMTAHSLQQFGDFALLVCQNAMQAMNVRKGSSQQMHLATLS